MLVDNGICPSGYTPLSSETECKGLAGQTVSRLMFPNKVSNTIVGSFGISACRQWWTPPQTCHVYGSHLYFVDKDCGQTTDTTDYTIHHLVCKKTW